MEVGYYLSLDLEISIELVCGMGCATFIDDAVFMLCAQLCYAI